MIMTIKRVNKGNYKVGRKIVRVTPIKLIRVGHGKMDAVYQKDKSNHIIRYMKSKE